MISYFPIFPSILSPIFHQYTPIPTSHIFSITHEVQLVPPICAWVWSHWIMGNLPIATSSIKSDYSSPSNYLLAVDPQCMVRTGDRLSCIWKDLGWLDFFHRSCTGNHSYCEFMSLIALPCPEDNSQHYSPTLS